MSQEAPPTGSRTLCELQCRLVSAPAGRGALPGPAAPDADLTYPSAAQPDVFVAKCPSGQWESNAVGGSAAAGPHSLRPLLQQLVGALPRSASARLERLLGLMACPPPGRPLAWHPRQPLLAAVEAGSRALIFDYAGHLPLLGQGSSGAAPPPLQPTLDLQHELQQGAAAAAWRPHGGKCLAVGVEQGVCLWHLGRPPAGSGIRSDSGAWLTWLKAPTAGAVTSLAWHPQGHLLAGASPQSAGFFVWDVATGTATPVAASPEPVSLLRWSPCGAYLLSGHPGGDFRVWETQTWWSQSWAAAEGGTEAGSGALVEACWAPDSRAVLLAYANAPQLVSLHFTGEPPSLQAQLLPLPLPQLSAKGSSSGLVEAVAWDARAQRLAVAVGGSHPAAGCVALYDTRCDPILSARFVGFMRLGPLAARGASRGVCEPGWEAIEREEVGEAARTSGGGATARRSSGATAGDSAQLAFMPGFPQGVVLAARLGDHVAAVPLYFAA